MAAAKSDIARGVVARGRTVCVPHPTKRRPVKSEAGATIEAPVIVEHGPGAEVELPVDEIKWLRKAGYLIDTAAPELPTANGPEFTAAGNGEGMRLNAGE